MEVKSSENIFKDIGIMLYVLMPLVGAYGMLAKTSVFVTEMSFMSSLCGVIMAYLVSLFLSFLAPIFLFMALITWEWDIIPSTTMWFVMVLYWILPPYFLWKGTYDGKDLSSGWGYEILVVGFVVSLVVGFALIIIGGAWY